MAKLLGNAFSLNMLATMPASVHVGEVSVEDFAKLAQNARSVVGHPDTATVLASQLGFDVPANRESVTLNQGDVLFVAQYVGPRLPEGATQLPEGAQFKYLVVQVD